MFAKKYLQKYPEKSNELNTLKRNKFLKDIFLSKSKSVLCHFVLLFCSFISLNAQPIGEKTAIFDQLILEGFENVFVESNDTAIIVGYENRRYRFEPRALKKTLEIIDQNLSESHQLQLIIYHQKIPMLWVDLHLSDYRDFQSGNILMNEFAEKLTFRLDANGDFKQSKASGNPSNFKTDLIVLPTWRAQFGDFDRPVQSNFNVIPGASMLLAKGLSIHAEMIIPVQNNFFFDDEQKEIRPGLITLNQLIRLDDNVFLQATAGFFSLNRAGLNFEMKKFNSIGNLAFGLDIGYTAYHTFTEKRVEYFVTENYLTGLFSVEYRHMPYDAIGRLQVGNFIYNDLALRFDVLRQFGEVNIGFFALLSASGEFNGGFNFSIPIPPGKFMKPGVVRIRQANRTGLEYRAKGRVNFGRNYRTGHELFNTMLEYNPDFLKKRFLIELH